MPDWLFTSWESLGRTAASGALAYVVLVALLRVSGKRTLSKMNAFDFVVTVAFGSLLASVTLSDSVSVADGALALALLVFAQYAVTWLSVRSEGFQRLIKASPTLVFYRGSFLDAEMRRQRVTREEVLSAIRESGALSPSDVGAVIIETQGTLTVMGDLGGGDSVHALQNVTNPHVLVPQDRPSDGGISGVDAPG